MCGESGGMAGGRGGHVRSVAAASTSMCGGSGGVSSGSGMGMEGG